MDLAERRSTLAIKIVKVWFAMAFLAAFFSIFTDGIGSGLLAEGKATQPR